MTEIEFPGLAVAARQLGLDDGTLAESVLCKLDCGYEEMEAVRMSIIEALQRRGAYHGKLKAAIDSGLIFQMAEDGDHDGRQRHEGLDRRGVQAGPASSGLWTGRTCGGGALRRD
jgi:hypothetical protein